MIMKQQQRWKQQKQEEEEHRQKHHQQQQKQQQQQKRLLPPRRLIPRATFMQLVKRKRFEKIELYLKNQDERYDIERWIFHDHHQYQQLHQEKQRQTSITTTTARRHEQDHKNTTTKVEDFSLHNFRGETLLHILLPYQPPVSTVDLLIRTITNYRRHHPHFILPEEAKDLWGRNPLHIAAGCGCDVAVVHRLLQSRQQQRQHPTTSSNENHPKKEKNDGSEDAHLEGCRNISHHHTQQNQQAMTMSPRTMLAACLDTNERYPLHYACAQTYGLLVSQQRRNHNVDHNNNKSNNTSRDKGIQVNTLLCGGNGKNGNQNNHHYHRSYQSNAIHSSSFCDSTTTVRSTSLTTMPSFSSFGTDVSTTFGNNGGFQETRVDTIAAKATSTIKMTNPILNHHHHHQGNKNMIKKDVTKAIENMALVILTLLREYPAAVAIPDAHGWTPYALAVANHADPRILNVLQKTHPVYRRQRQKQQQQQQHHEQKKLLEQQQRKQLLGKQKIQKKKEWQIVEEQFQRIRKSNTNKSNKWSTPTYMSSTNPVVENNNDDIDMNDFFNHYQRYHHDPPKNEAARVVVDRDDDDFNTKKPFPIRFIACPRMSLNDDDDDDVAIIEEDIVSSLDGYNTCCFQPPPPKTKSTKASSCNRNRNTTMTNSQQTKHRRHPKNSSSRIMKMKNEKVMTDIIFHLNNE